MIRADFEAACAAPEYDGLPAAPSTPDELAAARAAAARFPDRSAMWVNAQLPRVTPFEVEYDELLLERVEYAEPGWRRGDMEMLRTVEYAPTLEMEWTPVREYGSVMVFVDHEEVMPVIQRQFFALPFMSLVYYPTIDRDGEGAGFDWRWPQEMLPALCVRPASEDECVPCPAGRYNSNGNCQLCPAGRTSVASPVTAQDCFACPQGRYANQDRGTCDVCPRGRWYVPANHGMGLEQVCPGCPAGNPDPNLNDHGFYALATLPDQRSQEVRARCMLHANDF